MYTIKVIINFDVIANAMKENLMSQSQLGREVLKISPSTLAKIGRGDPVSMPVAKCIAYRLGLDPKDVVQEVVTCRSGR